MAEGTESGSAGQTAAKSADQQRVTYRYIDRPECTETFADSILGAFFDGQSRRPAQTSLHARTRPESVLLRTRQHQIVGERRNGV